ncbi:hypothetical protein KEHDKFFH_02625 [Marinobacter maroccanus]|uniref:Uncharacterized protein n=1 Tax=Marinobacter maroccanus TaxID=2055143 RepID=A0A2S5ZDD2_9GAMM|nr:hypothetical protein [Marinobacter maroccanus]PPI85351.1 hypothetical protein KEHDKFFH_02625 [Marinobacter maroccanus]
MVDAKYKHEQDIDIERDIDGDTVFLELNLSEISANYVSEWSDIKTLLNRVGRQQKVAFAAECAAKEAFESGTAELNERLLDHGFKIVACENE